METSPAHPSATVIPLRSSEGGVEVLLLRRNEALDFHGGDWVFPGGRIDPHELEAGRDMLEAARLAAVREAEEEAGLVVDAEALVPISRWITPEILPKRFDAYFFATEVARDVEVRIDGGEIHDHVWMTPEEALAARARLELGLPPPTFVTLWELRGAKSAADVLERYRALPPELFEPRPHVAEDGFVSLYRDDAGYEACDPSMAGPRHRLWMLRSGWRYERGEGG